MTLDGLQSALLTDFAEVSRLSGLSLPASQMRLERLPAPHRRPSELPTGKCAVYGFLFRGRCLKVGKVGPRSAARFCSHHYLPGSSQSNLSKTILSNKPVIAGLAGANEAASIEALDEATIGILARKVDRAISCTVPARDQWSRTVTVGSIRPVPSRSAFRRSQPSDQSSGHRP